MIFCTACAAATGAATTDCTLTGATVVGVAGLVEPPNFCRMLSNDGGVNSKAMDSLENLANERLCKGLKPVTMLTATIATISLITANAIL